MQTELVLPTWLIVLLGILVSFSIIAIIYKIFSYRKINIVAKKIDYLTEDLIYKIEYITPVIESLSKLSNYIDLANTKLKNNSEEINKYVAKNKSKNENDIKKVKQLIKENKE